MSQVAASGCVAGVKPNSEAMRIVEPDIQKKGQSGLPVRPIVGADFTNALELV
jgi:hypothetical protein